MRVVIAPDSFGGTLTAPQAAEAIAAGWRAARPGDDLVLAPQSDGGPGFVDVLAVRFGQVRTSIVAGPLTEPAQARWLLDADTAYVECAQACGLTLLPCPPTPETALAAHSKGVGQLVLAALAAGARSIVVGLGGSACTDAGHGMLEALGGLAAARERLRDITLIAATDVEHPLLGPLGAARVFGPQKGADPQTVLALEARLTAAAAEFERAAGHDVAAMPGAGAAGGLGAALFACGAVRRSGAELIAEATGQQALLAEADLLITGEGRLDEQSLHGKVVTALAKAAGGGRSASAAGGGRSASAAGGRAETPVIAIAGQIRLSSDQAHAAGLRAAYSMSEFAGSVERALADAPGQLRSLSEHVAALWQSAP